MLETQKPIARISPAANIRACDPQAMIYPSPVKPELCETRSGNFYNFNISKNFGYFHDRLMKLKEIIELQGIGGLEGGLEGGGGYLHLVSAKTPLIEVDSDRESCV